MKRFTLRRLFAAVTLMSLGAIVFAFMLRPSYSRMIRPPFQPPDYTAAYIMTWIVGMFAGMLIGAGFGILSKHIAVLIGCAIVGGILGLFITDVTLHYLFGDL